MYPSMHWGSPCTADGYCRRQYASYWNTFLLCLKLPDDRDKSKNKLTNHFIQCFCPKRLLFLISMCSVRGYVHWKGTWDTCPLSVELFFVFIHFWPKKLPKNMLAGAPISGTCAPGNPGSSDVFEKRSTIFFSVNRQSPYHSNSSSGLSWSTWFTSCRARSCISGCSANENRVHDMAEAVVSWPALKWKKV